MSRGADYLDFLVSFLFHIAFFPIFFFFFFAHAFVSRYGGCFCTFLLFCQFFFCVPAHLGTSHSQGKRLSGTIFFFWKLNAREWARAKKMDERWFAANMTKTTKKKKPKMKQDRKNKCHRRASAGRIEGEKWGADSGMRSWLLCWSLKDVTVRTHFERRTNEKEGRDRQTDIEAEKGEKGTRRCV